MADKHNPDDPEYDWLYASQDDSPRHDSGSDSDPEATQLIGRSGPEAGRGRPRSGEGGGEPTRPVDRGLNGPGEEGADHTRVMGTQPRPPDSSGGSAQSFGGTYDAPDRDTARLETSSQPPGGGGYAPPPAPRKRRRNWWLRGFLLLLLLWLIFLIAVPVYAWTKITEVDAEPGGDRPDDTSGTTYLLVGSDSRADLSEKERGELGTGNAAGNRTDTILLLHVTDGGGPNVLLSIPRDSFVEIPGNGQNKINAAYSIGGADLLVATVEANTGLHVDNYIEIGFGGFVDIVDAVGGIQICPGQAIKDRKAKLDVEKGCQEADGQTALGYSRSRAFPRGDITRALHQREVIAGVGRKAASWQTVVLPWRYWSTNMAGAQSLVVGEDVGPLDLARFAWAMSKSGGDDTLRCVVPYSTLGASTSAGSAVLWDEAAAESLFSAIGDDDTSSITCAEQ